MTEFKIGDRVRYIRLIDNGNPPAIPIGTTGTIYAIYARTASYPYAIRTDEGIHDTLLADELELVHLIARTHQVRP